MIVFTGKGDINALEETTEGHVECSSCRLQTKTFSGESTRQLATDAWNSQKDLVELQASVD